MTKKQFHDARSTYRARLASLPLAADGAPQWPAQDWLLAVTPAAVRNSLPGGDPLAFRAKWGRT